MVRSGIALLRHGVAGDPPMRTLACSARARFRKMAVPCEASTGSRACGPPALKLRRASFAATVHRASENRMSAKMAVPSEARRAKDGGEGGIRTPGTVAGPAVFKTAAIDHSATSPWTPPNRWVSSRIVERAESGRGACHGMASLRRKLSLLAGGDIRWLHEHVPLLLQLFAPR